MQLEIGLFLQVFANSYELNPTLAFLPILCILMRLPVETVHVALEEFPWRDLV